MNESRTDFFSDEPLPTLPAKKVKIGSVWPSRFQLDDLNLDTMYTVNSLVRHLPARGELVGMEWEMGHPCAKIVNTLAGGRPASDGLAGGSDAMGGEGFETKETIWFALDRRQIVKIIRTETRNELATSATGYGTNPGGVPGVPPGVPTPGRPPGGGKADGDEALPPPPISSLQKGRGGGMAFPGAGGGQLGGRGVPGMGGRPGGNMGGAPASTSFVRVTREFTFVLEQ